MSILHPPWHLSHKAWATAALQLAIHVPVSSEDRPGSGSADLGTHTDTILTHFLPVLYSVVCVSLSTCTQTKTWAFSRTIPLLLALPPEGGLRVLHALMLSGSHTQRCQMWVCAPCPLSLSSIIRSQPLLPFHALSNHGPSSATGRTGHRCLRSPTAKRFTVKMASFLTIPEDRRQAQGVRSKPQTLRETAAHRSTYLQDIFASSPIFLELLRSPGRGSTS